MIFLLFDMADCDLVLLLCMEVLLVPDPTLLESEEPDTFREYAEGTREDIDELRDVCRKPARTVALTEALTDRELGGAEAFD